MPRSLRWTVLFALLGALATSGLMRAGEGSPPGPYLPPAERSWLQIQTVHFTIFTDAPEKRALDLGLNLERFRATLAAYHPGFRLDSPQPTNLFVFRNNQEYGPYKLRMEGKPADVEGMFHGSEDMNYVTLSAAWNRDPRPTIYHEFVHEMLRMNLAVVPAWFNEGFAEYYSTFTGDERRAAIGLPVEDHVWWLSTHSMIPLRQLFTQEYDSGFYTDILRKGVFYAESWALVHYLLGKGNSDERRARAGDFLDRLQQGQALEPAFSGAFGMPFEAMEKELRDYVAREQFPVAHISFSDKFKVDTSSRTSPLSRDDALARLGGLLLALGPERHDDAEAHFREALRLNPANGLAFMGLGNLLAERGRLEEAVGCYEKASLLLPDDPLLCYYHARALLGHSSAPAAAGPAGNAPPAEILARARSLLARATQLRPQFAPAYAELGWSYAAAAGEVGEGIAALEKARELVPSRVDVAANLFSLYLRAGQAGKARAMYEKILVPAGNRQVIEWARLALEQEQAVRPATGDSGGTGDGPAAGAAMPPAADRTILVIEQAAEEATDLEKKQRLQEIAEALKQDTPSVVFNEQVRVLNEAVALANRLDYAGAIAIVEKVLPSIQEPELRKQAEQMLARLRQDEQKQRGQRK